VNGISDPEVDVYASYASATMGVTANLAAPAGNTGDAAGDSYNSVDNLVGSAFADTLIGDADANILLDQFPVGAADDDVLMGGDGDDFLVSAGGNDMLDGGAGADSLWVGVYDGYPGGTVTVLGGAGDGIDTIADFSGRTDFGGGAGEGDHLMFNGDVLVGTFAYLGSLTFTATGNTEARVADGRVFLDADGNGSVDIQIALTGLTSADQLSATDFLVF
jgi:serralysin